MRIFGKTGSSFVGEIAICTLPMSAGFYLDTRELLSLNYCLSGNIFENALFHASVTPCSTLGMIAGGLYCACRCGLPFVHQVIFRHSLGAAAMLLCVSVIPHEDNVVLNLLVMAMAMILAQGFAAMLVSVVPKLVRSI